MADRKATIRIGARPDSSLGRMLRGTVDSARKSSREVEREQKRAADEGTRATREAVEEQKRLILSKQQTARSIAQREIREAKRAEKKKTADQKAELKKRENAQRESFEKRRKFLSSAGAGAAGAVGGAVAGAVQIGNKAQSVAEVDSAEGRLSTAIDFRLSTQDTANEAKIAADDLAKFRESFLASSEETSIHVSKYAEAWDLAQSGFDRARELGEVMPDLARIAAGKNIDLTGLVNTVGSGIVGFKLETRDQILAYVDKLIATAERGALKAEATGGTLGSFMPDYALLTGNEGNQGASEMFAFAQTLAQYNKDDPGQIKTQMSAFLSEVKGNKKVQKALRQSGIQVFDDEGKIDIESLGQQFATSDKFRKRVQTIGTEGGGIFGREEAQRAAMHLMDTFTSDPEKFARLKNAEEGSGLASAASGLAKRQADSGWQLRNVGVKAQAATVRDADELAKAALPVAKAKTEWESDNPILAELLGPIGQLVGLAGGGLLLRRFLGGAGAKTGGGMLARAGGGLARFGGGALARMGLGAAGTALGAGALGALGTAALWAGAAGITGATTYYGTSKALDAMGYTGDSAGKFLFNLFGQRDQDKVKLPPMKPGADRPAQAPRPTDVRAESDYLADRMATKIKDLGRGRVEIRVIGPAEVTEASSDGLELEIDSGLAGMAQP
jgi:hypothetical protein